MKIKNLYEEYRTKKELKKDQELKKKYLLAKKGIKKLEKEKKMLEEISKYEALKSSNKKSLGLTRPIVTFLLSVGATKRKGG